MGHSFAELLELYQTRAAELEECEGLLDEDLKEAYGIGREDGYDIGYDVGHDAGLSEEAELTDNKEAYKQSREVQHEKDYNEGYDAGYNARHHDYIADWTRRV